MRFRLPIGIGLGNSVGTILPGGLIPRQRYLRRAVAALLLVAVFPLAAQRPQPVEYTEYQVKAQYLSNFGRFVKKWANRPAPSPEEAFDLCVLGTDPFGPALDAAVKGENINGAPVTAKRITRVQDALACRVLYIGSSESNQLSAVLGTLGTAPVLTVADLPDFLKRGGMIQFVLDGNKVKFEINDAAAQRAGLNLSSELLKVARAVRRAP